jgi:hypothetical protein
MNETLKLNLEGLRVETFATQEAPTARGTVTAAEMAATNNISCRTFCFTTPCCPETQTCP